MKTKIKNPYIQVYTTNSGKETIIYEHVGQAEEIMREIPLYHNNIFFSYYDQDKGIWKTNAEPFLKRLIAGKLGKYSTIHRISETLQHIKNMSYEDTPAIPFEKQPYLLNFQNGVYDLNTDEFMKHEPLFYQISQLPYVYNPNATCPKIIEFLHTLFDPPEVQFIIEWFGYALIKSYPIQQFLILKGKGGNGKSTLINLYQAFLGQENTSQISLRELQENRFAKAHLYMKSANVFADIGDDFLQSTDYIKTLTGDDVLFAEEKGQKGFFFQNFAKLTFSANKLPQFKDRTEGMKRRLLVLPMERTFTEGKAQRNVLQEILNTPGELQGLANKAIRAIQHVMEQGGFSITPKMQAATAEWVESMDNVLLFVKEECILGEGKWIQKSNLFSQYKNWCTDSGYKSLGKNQFYERLQELPYNIKEYQPPTGDRSRRFSGIGLLNDNT